MAYRVHKYRTATDFLELIDLGDHAYAEWIVYEGNIPTFHVNCFREHSASDHLIKRLLDNSSWTFASLLEQIALNESRKLHLGASFKLAVKVSSELQSFALGPIPLEWVKKISK